MYTEKIQKIKQFCLKLNELEEDLKDINMSDRHILTNLIDIKECTYIELGKYIMLDLTENV